LHISPVEPMILESKFDTELTKAMADNSDSNLTVAKGLPDTCSVIVGLCLVKTGNNFASPSDIEHGTP
jgi:hypothetical protein